MSQKIALFIHELSDGGAQRVFVNLANSLVEQGIKVDMVLVRKAGVHLHALDKKVNVVDLKQKRTMFSIGALIKYLKREQPDVLLGALAHVNVIAIVAGKLARVKTKIAISEHSIVSKSIHQAQDISLKIAYKLQRFVYPFADKIIAVSHGVAEDLARAINASIDRIKVIHNPVVSEKLKELAAQEVEHSWLKDKQQPVILSAGRLHPVKDYPTLLKAFAKLIETMDARLIILGEGSEKDSIQALCQELDIENKVDLAGFIQNPYPYMKQADLLVMSSTYEGFGNVLVEAMACGTPVVATDCFGPGEIITNDELGILVPVGDYQHLSNAMSKAMNTEFNPQTLKEHSEKFSCDRVARKYSQVLLYDK